jgi:hypothetical protein
MRPHELSYIIGYLSSMATWEAEIGRILVPGQSGQKKFLRPHTIGKKILG